MSATPFTCPCGRSGTGDAQHLRHPTDKHQPPSLWVALPIGWYAIAVTHEGVPAIGFLCPGCVAARQPLPMRLSEAGP